MPNRNAIKRRLIARAQLRAANYGFSSTCEQYIKQYIEQGIYELDSSGVLNDFDRINQAENNLDKFVDEMIEEAVARGDDQLGENTFYAAKNRLCPLWPFC